MRNAGLSSDSELTLRREILATPIGGLILLCDPTDALRAADWSDCDARLQQVLRRSLGPRAGPKGWRQVERDGAPSAAFQALERYFAGERTALDSIPARPGGTPFQQRIWRALRAIPVGETRSYGALAAQLGLTSAARALGRANGANPISVVVPCHRLVGQDGALTGYAGGLARKRWLLAHEGVSAFQG